MNVDRRCSTLAYNSLFIGSNLLMVLIAGMIPWAGAQSISRENIIVSLAYGGNGQATSADYALNSPEDVAVDGSGNVFVVDTTNNVIREIGPGNVYITPSNFTSTTAVAGGAPIIAGTLGSTCTVGQACGDDSSATSATLDAPAGVALDSAGNVYIAGGSDPRVRVVCMNCSAGTSAYNLLTAEAQSPENGNIYTIAGNGTAAYRGHGGLATSAELKTPTGVAVDDLGNLYIADSANNRVRLVCASCSSGAAYNLLAAEGQSGANGDIYTVAGNATQCSTSGAACGINGLATSANLYSPAKVAIDRNGNLYIDDRNNCRVSVTYVGGYLANYPNATVTSLTAGYIYGYVGTVGTCASGADTGNSRSALSATLNKNMYGIALDGAGNLYFGDYASGSGGEQIHEVSAVTGLMTPFAGAATACSAGDDSAAQVNPPEKTGACGDGMPAWSTTGGASSSANLNGPYGLTFDSAGNMYFADRVNQRVREVYSITGSVVFPATTVGSTSPASGTLTIPLRVTGTPTVSAITPATSDYALSSAAACSPTLPTSCPNLLTAGSSPTAGCYTLCATFTPQYAGKRPVPVTIGSLLNLGLNGIGKAPELALTPGASATVAGNGTPGYTGDPGLATSGELSSPASVALDSEANLYIADEANKVIREVSAGNIETVVPVSANLGDPSGLSLDAGNNIYIADSGKDVIWEWNPVAGAASVIAGTAGTASYTGDGGAATSATLNAPSDVAVDQLGNYYIADTGNNVIRKVSVLTGAIGTVAGEYTLGSGYGGDSGPAVEAQLNGPTGIAVDLAGNLYIADTGNQRVREVSAATGVISTVAGSGTACSPAGSACGDSGLATAANLNSPAGVRVDAAGNIYIADAGDQRVREVIAATADIITVEGSGTQCTTAATSGCADGGSALTAQLNNPTGVALDGTGDVYIADQGDDLVREVNVLTAPQLTFQPTPAGSQSSDSPQLLQLSNAGNAALSFLAPLAFSSSFQSDSSSTCPPMSNVLASGATCTLGIDFIPATNGLIDGTATVSDNTNGSTTTQQQIVELSGQGNPTAPTITSSASTTFVVGIAGAFTVTTTGAPTPTPISESGSLPSGVTFLDNGNGTATLSGTPASGTTGTYPLTVTASNEISPNASQSFTLTVVPPQAPTVTSANSTTFTTATADNFTVTTTGAPTPTPITEVGALPGGVTFVDNGNGTAALSGTPAQEAGGNYPFTITASNGVSPNATQSFALTVDQVPIVTSSNSTTFTAGTAGNFTVTTSAFPIAVSSLTGGMLPSGATLVDNGNGTATLSSSAATAPGNYPFTIAAQNCLGSVLQSFTLFVTGSAPTINSANGATFTANQAGSFTVTTIGTTTALVNMTSGSTLPAGVTFTSNLNGTATLAGTPTATGSFSITFTASNTSGSTQQSFTLTVN